MNFEEIKVSNKNLTVIKNKQRNASYARNKLLSVFYNSNEEYCILSDDDTFLKYKVTPSVDCESYVNDYNKGKTFTEKISSSFLVLKNIRPKLFFDETLEANQDLDFGIILNKAGFKTIRNSTEQVEIFRGNSSMFENGVDKIYKKEKSLIQIKNSRLIIKKRKISRRVNNCLNIFASWFVITVIRTNLLHVTLHSRRR